MRLTINSPLKSEDKSKSFPRSRPIPALSVIAFGQAFTTISTILALNVDDSKSFTYHWCLSFFYYPPLYVCVMFEDLSSKIESAVQSLKGQSKISDVNIAETVREIRRALLDADVNLEVARSFTNDIKDRVMG